MFIKASIIILYISTAESIHGKSYYETFTNPYHETKRCNIGSLKEEIRSYQPIVNYIIDYVLNGPFKGRVYNELEKFVDEFGPRMSGTSTLEKSIDYMINLLHEENVYDVVTEELPVPRWRREEEKLTMLLPRPKNMALLGLKDSPSTPARGITAQVVVVTNFTHFDALPDSLVKGKIVLFNAPYTSYHETVEYREKSAVYAARKGAVAALVRSITPFSTYLPHTGNQVYNYRIKKIPAAAITIEDASLIHRLVQKGKQVYLNLKMKSTLIDGRISRNTITDIKGIEKPEQQVIVSGHVDSWDVGEGALDDGGGLFISWAVPVLLKQLNITPRRTVRSIFWTSEETGLVGAKAYEYKHRHELKNINFIMESDDGTFAPLGLKVAGTPQARCIIAEVLNLFKSINASTLVPDPEPGSDITVIIAKGVPGASLHNANEKYFWFHHTEADTLDVQDPRELDLCTAFWTAVSYVLADISVDIPRE